MHIYSHIIFITPFQILFPFHIFWLKFILTFNIMLFIFQIQFCIIFYHNFFVMFCDCNYPKFINFLLSLNAGLFLYMFGNFYYRNYVKANSKPTDSPKQAIANGKPVADVVGNVANGVGPTILANGKTKEC